MLMRVLLVSVWARDRHNVTGQLCTYTVYGSHGSYLVTRWTENAGHAPEITRTANYKVCVICNPGVSLLTG